MSIRQLKWNGQIPERHNKLKLTSEEYTFLIDLYKERYWINNLKTHSHPEKAKLKRASMLNSTTLLEELISIVLKLFQKVEEEGVLLN